MVELHSRLNPNRPKLLNKLTRISWGLITLTVLIAAIGFAMLYSAAGGDVNPWAERQLIRFICGLGLVFIVSLVDIRFWMRSAYFLYAIALGALILVEIYGLVGMGAQRWLHLGWIQIQPSEIMKIALILALASYFHGRTIEELKTIRHMLTPLAMVFAPMLLVLRQPDLGTAVMLGLGGAAVFFVAGAALRYFAVGAGAALAGIPIAWQFLEIYQQKRILTFLNPDADPLGAGYHIIQSKIAVGSGGFLGKGFLKGTQGYLEFLPEKHTDFIFTLFSEEFGFIGSLFLLLIYAILIFRIIKTGASSRSFFGKFFCYGFGSAIFIYITVNMAMVLGLLPIVGSPLPILSYGGSSMLATMTGLGIVMSTKIYSRQQIS